MFSLPSWATEICLGLLAICLFLFGGYLYGDYQFHKGEMTIQTAQAKEFSKVTATSSAVTTKVITLYVPKIEYIKGAVTTITKEVPVYVTKKDDLNCPVPNGFVSLWNNANAMRLPNDSAGVPTGTSKVVLSDIAAQHAAEAGICAANEARIDSMREWLIGQRKVYSK